LLLESTVFSEVGDVGLFKKKVGQIIAFRKLNLNVNFVKKFFELSLTLCGIINKNTMKIEPNVIRKQMDTECLGQIVVGLIIKKHSALIGRKKKLLNAEHANKYLILNLN